jgi:NADH-quinone oxidoreductase subunit J
MLGSASIAVIGFIVCGYIIFNNIFKATYLIETEFPFDMKVIGKTLMGTDKYQFLLPFEAISILLLACIIGGIMIARKR